MATVTAHIDLENDDGLFMARMLAAFAVKESPVATRHVSDERTTKSPRLVCRMGSHRPFGYDESRMVVRGVDSGTRHHTSTNHPSYVANWTQERRQAAARGYVPNTSWRSSVYADIPGRRSGARVSRANAFQSLPALVNVSSRRRPV